MLTSLEKYRAMWGIAVSRDMGPLSGRMLHWSLLHSRGFCEARRLVLSIHKLTWQSRANASPIHSIHANTFTPFTRIVATKLGVLPPNPGFKDSYPDFEPKFGPPMGKILFAEFAFNQGWFVGRVDINRTPRGLSTGLRAGCESAPFCKGQVQVRYRCILNDYPTNSKTMLWGNFWNYPVGKWIPIWFFGVTFLLPKSWLIHIMWYRITPNH